MFFLSFIVSNSVAQHAYICVGHVYDDSIPLDTLRNFDIIIKKDTNVIVKVKPNQKNNFYCTLSDSGNYIFQVYHPDYFLYSDTITITKPETDLGVIKLEIKSTFLDEVIIKDNFTNRINKDTTEFTADSFLIKQFSSAKELLKKIPGIQIGLNGSISYNGKIISNVSLDGSPFLTLTPDKLLDLLRGKDIERVKLYGLRSQLSQMTGIDDNSRNIGLDLILKEEAKKGYYGKLASGTGASKLLQWDNSGNVNSFNDNRRIMLFANINNTDGSSSIGEMTMPEISSPPQGRPQYLSGGGHYDTRLLRNKKLSLNLDYVITTNNQQISTTSNSINLIPGNGFKTQGSSASKCNGQNHNLNISTAYELSKSASVNISISANINTGNNHSQMQSLSYGLDGTFLNSSTSKIASTLHSPNTLANITYQKTFDKTGRSFNLSFTSNLNKTASDIEQISNSDFNTSTSDEKITQHKNNFQNSSNYTINAHYAEPLTKNLQLNFSFIISTNSTLSNNNTYDIYELDGNLIDSLNPRFSNQFIFKNVEARINTGFQYQAKKTSVSLGGDAFLLSWNQKDLTNNNALEKKYLNILPYVTFRYNMNTSSVISLDLRTQTTQPQLTEIQPISNNNDPLHIFIGNTDLTQSYTYNLSLSYSNAKPYVNRYFNVNASFSYTQNAISLNQYYNSDGKEISQYYNIDGNYSGNISANYNFKLSSKIQIIISENISISKFKNKLNNQENNTIEQRYSSNATFIYAIDTVLSIKYSTIFDYSLSNSSLISNSNSNIWNMRQNLDLTYNLPKGIILASRFNWNLRPKLGSQDYASNIFLWNLSIGKTLRKNEAVTVKLFVYDIGNQNKSNFIYYGPNLQSESTTTTIGRYAMLGLIWNFTKRKH